MKKKSSPHPDFQPCPDFFFAVSFPRTLRFQLSKKDKKMTPEEKPKRTENEEENPHLHQNWCQYHLCSAAITDFLSGAGLSPGVIAPLGTVCI